MNEDEVTEERKEKPLIIAIAVSRSKQLAHNETVLQHKHERA